MFVFGSLGALLILRGGLLASVSAFTWLHIAVQYPIPTDPAVGYFPTAIVVPSLSVVAALYGACVSARPGRSVASAPG